MVPGPARSTSQESQEPAGERRHPPLLPGLAAAAGRRRSLLDDLVERRVHLGLTQTEVAARMGTSQSAVARLEAGGSDARFSTVERYAAALGQLVDWKLSEPGSAGHRPSGANRGPSATSSGDARAESTDRRP